MTGIDIGECRLGNSAKIDNWRIGRSRGKMREEKVRKVIVRYQRSMNALDVQLSAERTPQRNDMMYDVSPEGRFRGVCVSTRHLQLKTSS
jgi:hypothetical protein